MPSLNNPAGRSICSTLYKTPSIVITTLKSFSRLISNKYNSKLVIYHFRGLKRLDTDMKNMISLSNYFYSNLRQKEMEAKDNQLKMSRKPNGEKSSDDAKLSENKNSEAVKPGKREGTSKPSETKPVAKKIKGSDYAAWDKFNVEEDLVIFVASTSSRFLFVSFFN